MYTGVTIIPLAILDDNYCYVVVDDTSRIAVAIDAADPEAVKVSTCSNSIHYSFFMITNTLEVCSGEEFTAEGSSYNPQALASRQSFTELKLFSIYTGITLEVMRL